MGKRINFKKLWASLENEPLPPASLYPPAACRDALRGRASHVRSDDPEPTAFTRSADYDDLISQGREDLVPRDYLAQALGVAAAAASYPGSDFFAMKRTAVHESGHALVGWLLGVPISKATIIFTDGSQGTVWWSKHQLTAETACIMARAGAAAEKIVFGDTRPLSSTDHQLCLDAAEHLHASKRVGFIFECHDRAHELLWSYRQVLGEFSDLLFTEFTLSGDQIDAFLGARIRRPAAAG